MLKKIYANDPHRYLESLKRNSQFFNTNQHLAPFIMGLTLSMEKENAANPNFDTSSINGIKVALMGPFAGVGDSFFYGVLRIIATGIAIGLASQGNPLGPLLFLLIYNIPSYLLRYYGGVMGYRLGSKYIRRSDAVRAAELYHQSLINYGFNDGGGDERQHGEVYHHL